MGSQALAPYAQEWLETEAKLGGRNILKGTALEQRAQFNAMGAALAPLLPPLPRDKLDVEDATAGNGLRVRVYTPKEGGGNLPFGVYFHPGGFIMGSIESDDYICRVIATSTPCVLVSVEYRLAPEHKFPAAHDDAQTAYKWACENISKYGASPSKGFVIGQSAGATVAISTALSLKDYQQYKVNGVAAISPVTCAPSAVPSHLSGQFKREENADSAVIDEAGLGVYLAAYDPPPNHPAYSILLSPDLASLPPTYLVASGKDPLRDDTLVFERVAREAGVSTKLDYYEGFPHLFWIIPALKKSEEAVADIIEGVKWVISKF